MKIMISIISSIILISGQLMAFQYVGPPHLMDNCDPYKYNKNGQWLKNNHLKNCIILTIDKN